MLISNAYAQTAAPAGGGWEQIFIMVAMFAVFYFLMIRPQQKKAKEHKAMVEALGAQGSFVAMNNTVSQSVPHLHCHVVPRTKGDGLRGFFWPRTTYADVQERDTWAARLGASLQ